MVIFALINALVLLVVVKSNAFAKHVVKNLRLFLPLPKKVLSFAVMSATINLCSKEKLTVFVNTVVNTSQYFPLRLRKVTVNFAVLNVEMMLIKALAMPLGAAVTRTIAVKTGLPNVNLQENVTEILANVAIASDVRMNTDFTSITLSHLLSLMVII